MIILILCSFFTGVSELSLLIKSALLLIISIPVIYRRLQTVDRYQTVPISKLLMSQTNKKRIHLLESRLTCVE